VIEPSSRLEQVRARSSPSSAVRRSPGKSRLHSTTGTSVIRPRKRAGSDPVGHSPHRGHRLEFIAVHAAGDEQVRAGRSLDRFRRNILRSCSGLPRASLSKKPPSTGRMAPVM